MSSLGTFDDACSTKGIEGGDDTITATGSSSLPKDNLTAVSSPSVLPDRNLLDCVQCGAFNNSLITFLNWKKMDRLEIFV